MTSLGTLEGDNQEEVQTFINNKLDQYTVDKFEDWSLDDLHNYEFKIEIEFMQFKSDFPPEGGLTGPWRGYAYADSNEEKYPLSSTEERQLRETKHEIIERIYQAKGPKIEKFEERQHTVKIKTLEIIKGIVEMIKGIIPRL